MNNQNLIERFESELSRVQRPGMDKLLHYIRKSDFYIAPASTRFHLSCEGGLLRHSLNVLDALRGLLHWNGEVWEYQAAGRTVDRIPDDSVTVMALLHDLCKTYFYAVGARNVKNEQTGKWEKAPFYTVNDRMPLGHGDKSAMLAMQFIKLTNREMYAIWHHMGLTGDSIQDAAVSKSIELYPAVLALQTADMIASKVMESETGNKPDFVQDAPPAAPAPKPASNEPRSGGTSPEEQASLYASQPDGDGFEEAPAL